MTPFFPRGKGCLMSVLIPSRGRPDLLRATINSFNDLANDRGCFEFVLKLDEDDAPTLKMIDELEHVLPIKKLVSPRGKGYQDLHLWMNQLAMTASGDWLWIFDDDAKITTPSWDKVFSESYPLRPYIGIREMAVFIPNNAEVGFPCVRRGLFELLGHLSQDCICDRYIHLLCSVATKVMQGPLQVAHDEGNVVHSQPMDQDKKDAYNEDHSHFLSLESRRHLVNDCNKVLRYLEDREWNAVWTPKPVKDGWHICNNGNEKFPVFVQESGECLTPIPILEGARWFSL